MENSLAVIAFVSPAAIVWLGYFWIDLLLLVLGAVLLIRLYGLKWLLFNLKKGR